MKMLAQYMWSAGVAGAVTFAAAATAGCGSAPGERVGSSAQNLDARFDPGYPAPVQTDDWSCSVHTTTWMLKATGHAVTWAQVSAQMQRTGRVSPAVGLTDANGPGVAATLRDFADGSPNIQSRGIVSFDDVAAKAGHMAVGIGGRAWNHWSAVRGYDAVRDVLLLANSAPSWKGAGQELTRGEFAALGAMAMVWMDYGQAPPPPPFEPAPRPTGGPFAALHVKAPVEAGLFVTQCNESGDGERVWQTTSGGPDPETRWAAARYPQTPTASCGDARDGIHPLVLRSAPAGALGGTWLTHCTGTGEGLQRVYRVDGDIDGHPAAAFLYHEANADCE